MRGYAEAPGSWGDGGGVARGASSPVSASSQNPRAQLNLTAPWCPGEVRGPASPSGSIASGKVLGGGSAARSLPSARLASLLCRRPAGSGGSQTLCPDRCWPTLAPSKRHPHDATGSWRPQQGLPQHTARAPCPSSHGTLAEGEDARAVELLTPDYPARRRQKAIQGRRPKRRGRPAKAGQQRQGPGGKRMEWNGTREDVGARSRQRRADRDIGTVPLPCALSGPGLAGFCAHRLPRLTPTPRTGSAWPMRTRDEAPGVACRVCRKDAGPPRPGGPGQQAQRPVLGPAQQGAEPWPHGAPFRGSNQGSR